MNKFLEWIHKNLLILFCIVSAVTLGGTILSMIDITKKPPVLKDFGDGVQNHLVWSAKGECFFVRPYSNDVVYLIRVQDCDKK